MSRFTFCNCPAGFSAPPERHAPDCPGRSGAGKARTPIPTVIGMSAAPQPPALGGEPDVRRYSLVRKGLSESIGGRWMEYAEHRNVCAPLQAEIERWKAISAVQKDRMDVALELAKEHREERDQLKARCDELEGFLKSAKYVVEAARTIEKIAFREGAQNVDPANFRGLGILLEQYDAALSKPTGSDPS